MYPISFDNPNKANGRNSGKPLPANRNSAGGDAETGVDNGRVDLHHDASSSLLVVECRRDDKWRVELCTDLSELDGALDMARALRSSSDVDEVCLTLEVSGENGRESRREVLRFDPENALHQPVAETAPVTEPVVSLQSTKESTTEASVDPHAMAVLNATLKVPDYDLDRLDFSEFAMPSEPAPDVESESDLGFLAEPDDTMDQLRYNDEEPINISTLTSSEQHSRQSAKDILSSIYGEKITPAAGDGDDAILVDLPEPAQGQEATPSTIRIQRKRNTAFGPGHSDWLDHAQGRSHRPPETRASQSGTSDDDDDAIERLEAPLFSQQNGLATKLLVFAGTLALLVLGGALAELLAVDITTTANAGVGAFDTLSPLQNDISR